MFKKTLLADSVLALSVIFFSVGLIGIFQIIIPIPDHHPVSGQLIYDNYLLHDNTSIPDVFWITILFIIGILLLSFLALQKKKLIFLISKPNIKLYKIFSIIFVFALILIWVLEILFVGFINVDAGMASAANDLSGYGVISIISLIGSVSLLVFIFRKKKDVASIILAVLSFLVASLASRSLLGGIIFCIDNFMVFKIFFAKETVDIIPTPPKLIV